uniref:ISAs1 family transposase n=2 Tax=Bracon brevicornis TaxID=1563983 RepID=A0A6V7KSG4_9HYME
MLPFGCSSLMIANAFLMHFGCLKDPRQTTKISYRLFDVLFLTICAVIAGAEGWEDIEDFGKVHLEWLQKKGLFPDGIPVHDTIARIISRLDPTQFRQCFIHWVKSVNKLTEGALVAIDGKVLRRAYDRKNRCSPIHMVSAFATHNGVVMGPLKTDAKSNEITAIPVLLKLLELKGCLISIDAMGCQTSIADTIVKQGGDYLLAVKGNQKQLQSMVKKALRPLCAARGTDSKNMVVEKGHGRIEVREYYVIPAGDLTAQFPEWKKLKTLGAAVSYRLDKSGKESLEYRYYISSAELDGARFASAVRDHWRIENSLHWVLDVSMNEDACPIRRAEAGEILSCMRHIALNMLRAEKTKKASIRRKQKIASMDSAYLEQILTAGFDFMDKK